MTERSARSGPTAMSPQDAVPAGPVPRPDTGYLLRVLRRQWLAAAAVTVGVAVPGLLATIKARDVYRSSVVAAFDRRDALTLAGDVLSSIHVEGVEQAFEARMTDPEFLGRLESEVGLRTEGRLTDWLTRLGILPAETEVGRRARLVQWFGKRLIPVVQGGSGLLTLNVYLDDTPDKAQALATAAMDGFIQGEIAGAAARVGIKLDFLAQTLAEARERLKELQKDAGRAGGKGRPVEQVDSLPLDLRQREAELLDRIKLAEGEVADLSDERVRRRTALEMEYERLSARLSANHPDLVAKRRELEAATQVQDPADSAARSLSRLRRELWRTRSEMLYPGAGEGLAGGFVSLEERMEANRIATIASRMEELQLERGGLERQVQDAGLRTLLKIVKPATYELKPYTRKSLQTGLAALALALGAGLAALIWREARSPLARDAWRVAHVTGLPILAQLARDGAVKYGRIGPAQADELRQRLFRPASGDRVAIRTLLAYRRLELSLLRQCQGRVVCLAAAGAADVTRDFFFSFANIVATDLGAPVVVVDFAAQESLTEGAAGGGGTPADQPDLLDVLVGKAPWRQAVEARGAKHAFDLLTVRHAVTGERTRGMNGEALVRLFTGLAGAYRLVLVRSLPESQFIENAALVDAVSDLLVGVDAARTTYLELNRTLVHLGQDKLRGLVLVGT